MAPRYLLDLPIQPSAIARCCARGVALNSVEAPLGKLLSPSSELNKSLTRNAGSTCTTFNPVTMAKAKV